MAQIIIKLVNGELAGKTMQEINKQVRDASVALSKATLGTDEFVKATEKLNRAKQLQADYKKQVAATTEASNQLKQAWADAGVNKWVDHQNQIKKGQEDIAKSTAIMKQQFGGIVNQIPGFSQLSGAFSSVKGGVGGLTGAMGPLRTAMLAIPILAIIAAITALIGWFSKTEKGANMISGAFKAITGVIDTLMNRIWNLGDTMKQLFSDPLEFFKNLGKDIVGAAKEGYELVQVFDDIEDRQRELDVLAKQNENRVDQLLLQSKNVATSYKERIALLDQADKLTRDSYNTQLALSREYQAAVEREVAQAEKQGTMGDELADKLVQAQLKVLDLEGQQISMEEKIQNRRDQIIGKQEKANEKLAADKEKFVQKEEQDLKKLEDLRVQSITNSMERELAAANLKFERELQDLNLKGEERKEAEKLIEDLRLRELQNIKDKYAAEAKVKDDQAKAQKEASDNLASEKAKQTAREEFEFKMALKDAELGLASTALGATVQLLSEDEKARKKNAAAIKAFSIAQIVVDTQREIAGYMANPASTASLGVVGTLKSVAAIIRAGVAIAKVNSQKFEMGGYLEGPRHSQGGIPIEAEGGEFIFSRRAVQGLGVANLAAMNNMFEAGGPVNPFEGGRTAAVRSAQTGASQGVPVDFNPVLSKLDGLIAAMDRRIDRLEVINDVTKTKKGLETLNKLQNDADV